MAKPEWGKKRACQSCGARFYDLLRDPIVCPKCEAVFDPLASLRPRRTRVAAAKPETKQKAPALAGAAAEDDGNDEAVDVEDEIEDIDGDDDEDEGLIEDASELGEDDSDMSSVSVDDEDD